MAKTIVIQFTGLSGAGKTTLATALAKELRAKGLRISIVDGDEFRNKYATDLGFSYEDRLENINRMANFVNEQKPKFDLIIISAVNPFNETREILTKKCSAALVYIKCALTTLMERDTKGLYRKALLPSNHPDYIANLTGVTQNFDEPTQASLIIDTSELTLPLSIKYLTNYYNQLCCVKKNI